MEVEELAVPGTWLVRSRVFPDDRGTFTEWFSDDFTVATGRPFVPVQANRSVSRRGIIRGLHYSDVPPGQAKWVSCGAGAVLDVVVDVRRGSPTFGQHVAVELTPSNGLSVVISEGLAHGFCALEDDAVVTYLVTSRYDPARERAITPLDRELGIDWRAVAAPVLSAKDQDAPTLAEAGGQLPTWDACQALYRS